MRRARSPQPSENHVSLAVLVGYLNRYLRVQSIPDVPGVTNGLQHANSGRIEQVICAVDACSATIAGAGAVGRSLLIVHHGLSAGRGMVAAARRRALSQSEVALFACHIPLDLHPTVGNNAILAGILGLSHRRPFGRYGRRRIGVEGKCSLLVRDLAARLEGLLGVSAYVVPGGPARTRRVAVITGNGTRWIDEAARAGIDTLVTGEAGHHDALQAEEAGINLVCAGHYGTETLGVKAVAAHLSDRFALPWAFIDHPTGL